MKLTRSQLRKLIINEISINEGFLSRMGRSVQSLYSTDVVGTMNTVANDLEVRANKMTDFARKIARANIGKNVRDLKQHGSPYGDGSHLYKKAESAVTPVIVSTGKLPDGYNYISLRIGSTTKGNEHISPIHLELTTQIEQTQVGGDINIRLQFGGLHLDPGGWQEIFDPSFAQDFARWIKEAAVNNLHTKLSSVGIQDMEYGKFVIPGQEGRGSDVELIQATLDAIYEPVMELIPGIYEDLLMAPIKAHSYASFESPRSVERGERAGQDLAELAMNRTIIPILQKYGVSV